MAKTLHTGPRTNIVLATSRALVTDEAVGHLSVLGVRDRHPLREEKYDVSVGRNTGVFHSLDCSFRRNHRSERR